MAPAEQAIRERVLKLCAASDLDALTERRVREQVARDLKLSDAEKAAAKPVVAAAIEEFLQTALKGPGGNDVSSDDHNDSAEEEEDEESSEGAELRTRPAKKARTAATSPAAVKSADGSWVAPLGDGDKRLTVKAFKGVVRVDLRLFYTDKATGEAKPGKQGISLSFAEWLKLAGALPKLSEAVRDEDTDTSIPLAPLRRAYVSVYKGRASAHVREFYTPADGGDPKPGKQGVALGSNELSALASLAAAATAQAREMGATADAPAGPSRAAPAAPAAHVAAPQAAAGATDTIDLGSNRRVSHSTFKGGNFVDLREFYEKDGQLLPGKKGIALKPDQWQVLLSGARAINDALAAKDTSFSLDLGGMRRATVSSFKNTLYVNVREYYTPKGGGEPAPGLKGLSLTPAQWTRLHEGAAAFTAGRSEPV